MTRVVCVGGGYVALWVVKALRRSIRRGEVSVTVISRDNYQTFHGFIGEMLSGRIQPQQILSPARRIFRPARFVNAEVTSIDDDERQVVAARRLDGREYVIEYDHLVIGVGVADDLERYPGLEEHALRLRDYQDAWTTRNHLIQMLELAAIETDPLERQRLLTFVIAGGGYGGVEVATELDEWAREVVSRDFKEIDPDEISVILVHSGQRILPELQGRHERLVSAAERFIASGTQLEVRAGVSVGSATATDLRLSDGSVISTRTVITSTGTASSPLLLQLPFDRDERGRVVVDEAVRVVGSDHVWAGGDCAAVPHPKGGTCPQVAIFAMAHGWWIGRNIQRQIQGQPLSRYRFSELGDACSLGRRHAVAHLRGVPFTGIVGWLIWKVFLLYFVPAWDRRLRILLDWLLTPVTGRELARFGSGDAVGMTREMYEPGQQIVAEGDIGQKLYLIWSGEVEVVRGGEVVATLGEGQHFGEIAVFEESRRTATVRATTRTEVIALGRAQAQSLSRTVEPFGASVRALPGAAGGHPPHDDTDAVDEA